MALTTIFIAVLYFLHSAAVSSGIGEVCNLGSTEVPETNFLDDGGQYLDFSNRATCTGSLTAWHYCYYADDIAASDTYLVYFRIWRMVDANNFERIHDYELRMEIDPPSNGETLICETATLDTPLDVQENDILGVFIPLTTLLGGLGLHIIARDAAGFELDTDTRDAFTAFPSTTLNTNDLESRTTVGLHLYADIAVDCVDLADPMNGQVAITPDVMATFDTDLCAVATYACSEGYSLVGDAMRTCQANGQWNGTEPTCEVIDCGDLTDPDDGQVTFTPGVVTTIDTGLEAVVTYTCSEDYSLVGDAMRTCQANSQWDGTEPTCMLIDCGGLNDPVAGDVTITPGVVGTIETGLNAVAMYTCNEGYHLVGDTVRTCQGNNQWDGAEPTCTLIDCGDLPDPEGGQVTFTPGVVTTVDTGLDAVATYTCNSSAGYMLFDNGLSPTRTCQNSGQNTGRWSGVAATCTRCDFSTLSDPENGRLVITTIGDEVTACYTCDMGYQLVGDAVLNCQSVDQFSGSEPVCDVIDCGLLPLPSEGQVAYTPSPVTSLETGLNATASYSCSDGYGLVGDMIRTCQANGQWDGADPTCMLVNCGRLTLPSEGEVAYTPGVVTSLETGLNAMASYSCSEGYDLDGDMIRTCQANGQWDGADPTCTLVNCGLLPLPSEGQVDYTPGVVTSLETGLSATASYSCSEGYGLVGDMIRTCQANGQWDGAEPTCMLIDCGGLGDPDNGLVFISPGLVTMTGVGAVATYTCNTSAGFMLVGTPMRTCQDNGQWSGMLPECIRCNTSSITDPGNGSVAVTSPGGVIIASYTCDVGYAVVGVASRTCQSDGQFSGQEPVCQVIDCGSPPRIDDGAFNVTETIFESIAEYGCNEGFTLSGSQSRTCQADGTWSGADPVCVAPASIQLGPVVGGGVAGFVVVALVIMAIIFGTVHVIKRKRKRHSTNNFQSNRKSDQATLTHFQDTEMDVKRNEAYITSAETSHNVAYIADVATSLNKAYGAHQSTDDSGADEYNYVINSLSGGKGNDKPAIEVYDYVRCEYPQTRT